MIFALCATASLSRSRIDTTAITLPPSTTGRWRMPSHAIGERVSEINGDKLARHDVRDRGRLQRFLGKDSPAYAISLGDDADHPPLIKNHNQPDVLVTHRLQRSQDAVGGASRPQFLRF